MPYSGPGTSHGSSTASHSPERCRSFFSVEDAETSNPPPTVLYEKAIPISDDPFGICRALPLLNARNLYSLLGQDFPAVGGEPCWFTGWRQGGTILLNANTILLGFSKTDPLPGIQIHSKNGQDKRTAQRVFVAAHRRRVPTITGLMSRIQTNQLAER
jgi:hypothetical protein